MAKLVRYEEGTKDLATFYLRESEVTFIAGFLDGDWPCVDLERKAIPVQSSLSRVAEFVRTRGTKRTTP